MNKPQGNRAIGHQASGIGPFPSRFQNPVAAAVRRLTYLRKQSRLTSAATVLQLPLQTGAVGAKAAMPASRCPRPDFKIANHRLPARCGWLLLLFLCLRFGQSLSVGAAAAEANAVLATWLAAQTNLQTWSAEFVQTRTLKALTQPLHATGRVWFAKPDRFRWELGMPPQTIAVRQPAQLLVLYPKLKRAERYSLQAGQPGPWRDAMALLEAGFPQSQAELDARFQLLALAQTNDIWRVTLQPKAASARRLMPQIQVEFSRTNGELRATQLTFADGSTLRNDFTNTAVNPPLPPGVFQPTIGADVTITEPGRTPR